MKFVPLTAVAAAALLYAATAGAHILRPGCNNHLAPKAELACAKVNTWHANGTLHWLRSRITLFDIGSSEQYRTAIRNHEWLARTMRARVLQARQRMRAVSRSANSGSFAVDSCTMQLLSREGGMNPHIWNGGYVGPWDAYSTHGGSGAYGGPQALPGSKMASAGPDWRDNIWTQIRWMIGYETARYGSPCAALAHSLAFGSY